MISSCSFKQFEKELQETVQDPLYKKLHLDEIEVGKCYLAKSPDGPLWCRVLVKKIIDDTVDCFYVDYGDYMDIPKTELKFLSCNLITTIPFQVGIIRSVMSYIHLQVMVHTEAQEFCRLP